MAKPFNSKFPKKPGSGSFADSDDPAIAQLRVPPHSMEAEQSVLGGLLLDNAAFGLEVRGTPRAEARAKARHALRLVGLERFETALPRQLSGGMAQRVGIARALTVQPEILLLDEPLAALDAMTKLTLQDELARIWAEEKVTMILVTHDLEEAIYLADRVLVLSRETETPPRLIAVPLPRPRDRGAPGFVALRRDLMRSFGLQ